MTTDPNLKLTRSKLPLPEKAFEWARQAELEKNWIEAAKRWAVLREAYTDHPVPLFQGAISHIEAGELIEAEILLNYAQEKFPNDPTNLIGLSALALHRQDWETAEDFLQQAREKHPNILQVWMKSAECAERQGHIELATTHLKKAVQHAPDRPGPLSQLAELNMRAEQWEQAIEYWKKVRDHFPDFPDGYMRAAEAARKLGRINEAKQLMLAQQYGPEFIDIESDDESRSNRPVQRASLKRLIELIWTKAKFNLRSEVQRNYLSYGWWVLEPLLHMVVYYVVFGFLLQRGGENFTAFLLTGLIPWMWFNKAVSISSNSILAGQNLILQVGLPSIVFPLVSFLQATLKQVPIFILLCVFIWAQGYEIGVQWWALFPVIFVQALLTIAFASAVAAVIPFARDLSYLVPTGLTFLMFMSGIFYDYKTISEEWQAVFLLNPVAFLLKCYREIFIDGVLPDLATLAWWGLGSIVTCLLLLLVYRRLRYVYPRIILE